MAKRFTDTSKWKKQFIKRLSVEAKLFWIYICDDCDHAGIWEVDFEVAKLRLGILSTESQILDELKENIQVFDGGTKWFIPNFIEFQYGELKEENRVHSSVISILKKYNIKPLISPLQGVKDKDKDKDMDKDKDKGEDIKEKTWRNDFEKLATERGYLYVVCKNFDEFVERCIVYKVLVVYWLCIL